MSYTVNCIKSSILIYGLNDIMQHNSAFLALVQDAKTRITEIDVHEVSRWLNDDRRFILVDVREESEWINGHIPNAIYLSKGVIERDIERLYPDKDTSLVLYCGGGFRSALAADNLKKMGYHDVISMNGGIQQWRNYGYPLTT